MPCRKENFLLLDPSVEAAEVDSLVSRLGEVLQLHGTGTGTGSHQSTVTCLHRGSRADEAPGPQKRRCLVRVWSRCGPYSRRKKRLQEDELLQELLLSGDLVKEAVRRLQEEPRT